MNLLITNSRVLQITAIILCTWIGSFLVCTTPIFHQFAGTVCDGEMIIFGPPSLKTGELAKTWTSPGYYPPLMNSVILTAIESGIRTRAGLSTVIALLTVLGGLFVTATRIPGGSGKRLGAAGFALYFIWPGVIGHARFVSMDALFLFAAPLAVFALFEWHTSRRTWWAILAGAGVGIGMLAKWSFGIFFAIPFTVILLTSKGRQIRGTLGVMAGVLVVSGWWYIFFQRWNMLLWSTHNQPESKSFMDLFTSYAILLAQNMIGLPGLAIVAGSCVLAIILGHWKPFMLWFVGGTLIPVAALSMFDHGESRYILGLFLPLTLAVAAGLRPVLEGKYCQVAALVLATWACAQGIQTTFGNIEGSTKKNTVVSVLRRPFIGTQLMYEGNKPAILAEEIAVLAVRFDWKSPRIVMVRACSSGANFVLKILPRQALYDPSLPSYWTTMQSFIPLKNQMKTFEKQVKSGEIDLVITNASCLSPNARELGILTWNHDQSRHKTSAKSKPHALPPAETITFIERFFKPTKVLQVGLEEYIIWTLIDAH